MDKQRVGHEADSWTAGLAAMYRRYLTGWAQDYLNFRAARRWELGHVSPAHETGELATMAGPKLNAAA